MSFVTDQLRKVDAQLGCFQAFHGKAALQESASLKQADLYYGGASSHLPSSPETAQALHPSSVRYLESTRWLEECIKNVSGVSSEGRICKREHLQTYLAHADHLATAKLAHIREVDDPALREYCEHLQWVLVGKLAAQTRGMLLHLLLAEIAPVMDDSYYWDGVLGSWRYSALYTAQILPERLWCTLKEAVADAQERFAALDRQETGGIASGMMHEWRQFYGLVQRSVQAQRMRNVQSRLLSPINEARMEARRRRKGLSKQKELCAAAIGVLTNEGLRFEIEPSANVADITEVEAWRDTVARSIKLMSSVFLHVLYTDQNTQDFEDRVLVQSRNEAHHDLEGATKTLADVLNDTYVEHQSEYKKARQALGRPSRWVRYWIPGLALALSSSAILNILVSRKAEITTWIRDLGQTTVDFYYNWVLEPIKRIIGTIRHDEGSEIALMSRESLQGDRASLERMVVDFAVEHPENVGADGGSRGPLTEEQIATIRDKVRAGDLTPVLRAYERDLKRPLARAITGNLVRELLIQIQKTKVDVEVAMAGIDALLRSQELVFGFVGLTPGVLVSVALGRWLAGVFGGRSSRALGKGQARAVRILRNIDRILTNAVAPAQPPAEGRRILSYKDHGLILCEVQALQATGQKLLPGDVYREFVEDLRELMDVHRGIDKHERVVERLRWAYRKWLH